MQFSHAHGTLFLAMSRPADGSCFFDADDEILAEGRLLEPEWVRGIYEFNPSPRENRNGLAPLTWRRLPNTGHASLVHPRSVELPDGSMLIGSRRSLHLFDPATGTLGERPWRAFRPAGDGLAEYHPSGRVLSLHGRQFFARTLPHGQLERLPAPKAHGKSLAVDARGTVFTWDGNHTVAAIDIDAPMPRWRVYDWSGAGPTKGNARVYSKWQYLEDHDVFVGISNHTTGVWVYKHPPDMPATESDGPGR